MKKELISTKPIFLCGMMGSGKSTVGRILSGKLNRPFTDLDLEIEKKEKMSIPDLFARRGEAAFRQSERELLEKVCTNPVGVIALGGGALQDQRAVDLVKRNGWLIFLEAPLSVLLKRLNRDGSRPLLQSGEAKEIRNKIEGLLNERDSYYLQAHVTVNTERLTPESIADTIINRLNKL